MDNQYVMTSQYATGKVKKFHGKHEQKLSIERDIEINDWQLGMKEDNYMRVL